MSSNDPAAGGSGPPGGSTPTHFPQLARLPLYPAEQQAEPSLVCVTGASSYVAGSIIPRLLAAGHTVHATVRDPADARRTAHLRAWGEACGGRLKLFKADLMSPGSFDAAVAGCRYVIHVASPVLPRIPPGKGQELLIEPAVRGVENVLAAVAKSLSVEAVVVTSSIGALLGDNEEKGQGVTFTEADWAQTTSAERLPYNHSKRQAERRAWELHDAQPQGGQPWRLATILPGFVVGPPASPDVPAEGVTFAKDLLTGRFWPAFPNAGFPFVDVDDVAAAHVLAMINPAVTGRFIVSAESAFVLDWLRELRPRFPGVWLPRFAAPRWLLWLVCKLSSVYPWDLVDSTYGKLPILDNSKVQRELGVIFHSPKSALVDELDYLLAAGYGGRGGKHATA